QNFFANVQNLFNKLLNETGLDISLSEIKNTKQLLYPKSRFALLISLNRVAENDGEEFSKEVESLIARAYPAARRAGEKIEGEIVPIGIAPYLPQSSVRYAQLEHTQVYLQDNVSFQILRNFVAQDSTQKD